MKTRERLKRIKESKSWMQRRQLAADQIPGTKFDWLIPTILSSLGRLERIPGKTKEYYKDGRVDVDGLARDSIGALGHDLARAIKSGNSKLFREWADAIDMWHAHNPQPDNFELAIQLYCVPPGKSFSMRSIVTHLEALNLRNSDSSYQDFAKKVREVCNRNKIKIAGKSGRPKK